MKRLNCKKLLFCRVRAELNEKYLVIPAYYKQAVLLKKMPLQKVFLGEIDKVQRIKSQRISTYYKRTVLFKNTIFDFLQLRP